MNDSVNRIEEGEEKVKEMKEYKHEKTRFSFGGFTTERLSFKQKWMEEYADFAEMEAEEEAEEKTRQISDGLVDMKKLEFESLDRQRRIKSMKYNERKKAAIKRQQS